MVKMMKTTNAQKSVTIFSRRNILLFALIAILSCGIIGYVIIARSCFFLNCVEERSFNALDLELQSDLFPNNAIVNPILRPSTSEGAFESGSKTIYWRDGNSIATYKVWRFRTEKEASKVFLAESGGTLYVENRDVLYQSSIADEFAVGCGIRQGFGYKCNMAARYQEYTVKLLTSIDQEMSIEEFNEVVIFIDQEMEQRLYGQSGE